MMRWLLLPLGLVVALAAAWLLLAPQGPAPSDAADPAPSARSRASAPVEAPSSGEPMGEIDAASRRELEKVLEEEGVGR